MTNLAAASAGVNGLTLGEDGAVYWADQGARNLRATSAGVKTEVTTTPLPFEPNGLAFGPDGMLYINGWTGMDVYRLKLDATGKETMRQKFATLTNSNQDSAIGLDGEGNIITTGGLHKVDPSNSSPRS